MDNKKSYIPRLLEKSKEMTGTERLASKISGCILYSGWYVEKRKCLFYVNHDQFENGSDMIVTLIYLLIEDFFNDHQKLPRKLHLNLGKSLNFFSYCGGGNTLCRSDPRAWLIRLYFVEIGIGIVHFMLFK